MTHMHSAPLAAHPGVEHLLLPISIVLVPARQHYGVCRVRLPAGTQMCNMPCPCYRTGQQSRVIAARF